MALQDKKSKLIAPIDFNSIKIIQEERVIEFDREQRLQFRRPPYFDCVWIMAKAIKEPEGKWKNGVSDEYLRRAGIKKDIYHYVYHNIWAYRKSRKF